MREVSQYNIWSALEKAEKDIQHLWDQEAAMRHFESQAMKNHAGCGHLG